MQHAPRYDYCDIMFSALCLHKKIVGSDIEGTFIFVILSTHPSKVSCLSRLLRSPSQQLHQWVQQKRAHIRKTTLMKELGKCVTAAQAVRWLDSLGIGINDRVIATARKASIQP